MNNLKIHISSTRTGFSIHLLHYKTSKVIETKCPCYRSAQIVFHSLTSACKSVTILLCTNKGFFLLPDFCNQNIRVKLYFFQTKLHNKVISNCVSSKWVAVTMLLSKCLIILSLGVPLVMSGYGGHDLFTSLSQLHTLWKNEQNFVQKMESAVTDMETMIISFKR